MVVSVAYRSPFACFHRVQRAVVADLNVCHVALSTIAANLRRKVFVNGNENQFSS